MEFKCEKCNKEFGSEDALNMHNRSKHPELYEKPKEKLTDQQKKRIRNWLIFAVILVFIIGGIYFFISNIKTLPPTDIQGHIEESPSSHILREPMSIPVQKHMLEHVDGKGRPGVIINYNCKDYVCEDGLIEKLEAFAMKYDYVYVAPFANMDAKIVLTKYGRMEILAEYDEEAIEGFINK